MGYLYPHMILEKQTSTEKKPMHSKMGETRAVKAKPNAGTRNEISRTCAIDTSTIQDDEMESIQFIFIFILTFSSMVIH